MFYLVCVYSPNGLDVYKLFRHRLQAQIWAADWALEWARKYSKAAYCLNCGLGDKTKKETNPCFMEDGADEFMDHEFGDEFFPPLLTDALAAYDAGEYQDVYDDLVNHTPSFQGECEELISVNDIELEPMIPSLGLKEAADERVHNRDNKQKR